ncbi:MAG: hypothetical protein IPK15_20835 [Verrucomicrobia bacterium]|nr:hypothetical protein [Verrucomicrobiota bacterium]
MRDAHAEELRTGNGVHPLMPAAFSERFIHDALLEEIQLAGRGIGLLLDGREQQRVQFGMTFLNLPGDGAVIRLPVIPARPDDERSENTSAHQYGNPQRERRAERRAGGEEKEGENGEDSPADGERAGPTPCALSTCYGFQLGFEQRFSHGMSGLAPCLSTPPRAKSNGSFVSISRQKHLNSRPCSRIQRWSQCSH